MPFEYWTGIQIHLTFNVWTNKTLVFGWLRILGVRYSDHDYNFIFCFASQQLSNPSSCVIFNLRNIVLKSRSRSRGSYPNKNVGKSRKKFATPGKQNLKKTCTQHFEQDRLQPVSRPVEQWGFLLCACAKVGFVK